MIHSFQKALDTLRAVVPFWENAARMACPICIDVNDVEAVKYLLDTFHYDKGAPARLCSLCGAQCHDDYMLEDSVWLTAWPQRRGLLHLSCVEQLLGRTLIADDFKDIPMNSAIRYLLGR